MKKAIIVIILLLETNVFSAQYLYVVNSETNEVGRYNANTGEFVDVFISDLNNPRAICLSNDNQYVYVSNIDNNTITRYNAQTGEKDLGFLASENIATPWDISLGADGYLYVSNHHNHSVTRYNSETGSYVDVFCNQYITYSVGLSFSQSGNLFVASHTAGTIWQFDGQTGDPVGTSPLISGFNLPLDIEFGLDGDLYLPNLDTNSVCKYDGQTGTIIDANFISTDFNPGYITLDTNGDIYVSAYYSENKVKKYDGSDGSLLTTFSSSEMATTRGIIFFDSESGVVVPEPSTFLLILSATSLVVFKKNKIY